MANHVNPERDRFGQFHQLTRQGPIHMLNLIRLKETAVYPDGTMVTGKEAYSAYGRESAPIFKRVGGKIVWSGNFELNLIGPEEEEWQIAFIAEYPSAEAFVEMVKDADYQAAVVHRTAAVLDSRLVRMEPKSSSATFG
ncbi:MAG: DUF1330 domain-containing protein [Pseudomonadota bacterium]